MNALSDSDKPKTASRSDAPRKRMPELYQVVIECRDEAEQREVYERMRAEGRKVRVHVL